MRHEITTTTLPLQGRWAIVTGASSGIGLEFTRQLAAMGCNLLMISNQPEELTSHAASIGNSAGIVTIPMLADLTDDTAVERIIARIHAEGITPYILINNAGIFDFRAVEQLTPQRIDLYIDLHIRAVTHLSRRVAIMMKERRDGYILNMSSMSCWMPMPGIAMYSASKAYIRAFSRALRIEQKGYGISVTVACPGGIATDLFGLPKRLQRLGVTLHALDTPERFVRKAIRRMLRRRAQYINGIINRLAIPTVAMLPEWARMLIKTRLLDRINR